MLLQQDNTEPVHVALCEFTVRTGWRVRAVSLSKFNTIRVIRFGMIKLLRIPMINNVGPGQFIRSPAQVFY